MLIDAKNRFVSQKTIPRMALIVPSFHGQDLMVEAPGVASKLTIPLEESRQATGPIVTVSIWGEEFSAVDEGDHAAHWFSEFLQGAYRLVRITNDFKRTVEEPFFGKGAINLVGFANSFPFMMISEESLDDLNSRLPDGHAKLPMIRFRPTIVVKADNNQGTPFMEDHWKKFTIGGVTFIAVAKCIRCKVTTVDPNKGEYDGGQPLEVLSTFRKGLERGGVELCFGENLVHTGEGEIAVGQVLIILE